MVHFAKDVAALEDCHAEPARGKILNPGHDARSAQAPAGDGILLSLVRIASGGHRGACSLVPGACSLVLCRWLRDLGVSSRRPGERAMDGACPLDVEAALDPVVRIAPEQLRELRLDAAVRGRDSAATSPTSRSWSAMRAAARRASISSAC